ncbi:MAG: FtsQ-type POTRA domain-containing protein [Chloroflexi bacterium]|nr:FtsQ-type POTRA domain-containing protein [Chloroflexota bacterium]
MPGQGLRVRKRNTLKRRPRRKLGLPTDVSFLGRNWSKRAGVWTRTKLLLLAALALLLWLGIYLISSPEFRVTDIAVKGNNLIRVEELIQLAGLQNSPILLVNTDRAERSIAQLKAVRSATVELEFPDRATIQMIERPAAYIWKVRDTLYLVSDDGIVLGTTPVVNQPLALVDVDARDLAVGDQIDVDALTTAKALSVLLPTELSLTPAYYEYSQREGVVLPTDFGGRVAFGNSVDLPNKVAILKSLRQTFQDEKLVVKYVDLRFQDRPYFR